MDKLGILIRWARPDVAALALLRFGPAKMHLSQPQGIENRKFAVVCTHKAVAYIVCVDKIPGDGIGFIALLREGTLVGARTRPWSVECGDLRLRPRDERKTDGEKLTAQFGSVSCVLYDI